MNSLMNHVMVLLMLVIPVIIAVTTPAPPTTQDPGCHQYDGECPKCVGAGAKCFYCLADKKCWDWPSGKILPPSSVCSLDDARWGVCWVNFKVLLITMGVLAGVIIISLTCCIYCCCCRRSGARNRMRINKDEERWERDRQERKQKSEERKAERQARADEIRAKYGLNKGPNYERFDKNEVA